ncbi:MAG: methyltransferase domain-containing protein [Pseudonocardiaceae bacterium]
MIDPDGRLRSLVDELADSGELIPAWRTSFLVVPRHQFIPDTIWRTADRGLIPLHRVEDPQGWFDRVYDRDAVVIQVDDGRPRGERGRHITSSASHPGVVARMLAALDARTGMNVLEIGTGSGYNAALLAHRLGAQRVTTIEVDSQLAGQARRALAATGFDGVTVIEGDGALGHSARAPYDRIISTAAVTEVPYAWVQQTRPGGVVLTPWATAYYPGALLSFTVDSDGSARGGIVGDLSFMWLRGQRPPSTYTASIDTSRGTLGSTRLHAHDVAGVAGAALAISQRVSDCALIHRPTRRHAGVLWFADPRSESWATLRYSPDVDTFEVRQAGPRRLWDEIEAAHQWWIDMGEPGVDAWRFTVTPGGQRIEPQAASSTLPAKGG